MADLRTLLSELSGAASITSEASDDRALDRLMKYCVEDENGNLVAQEITFSFFGREFTMPVFAMMGTTRLDPSELDLATDMNIDLDENGNIKLTNHSGLMSNAPSIEVSIKYRSNPTIEAIELVREAANQDAIRTYQQGTIRAATRCRQNQRRRTARAM